MRNLIPIPLNQTQCKQLGVYLNIPVSCNDACNIMCIHVQYYTCIVVYIRYIIVYIQYIVVYIRYIIVYIQYIVVYIRYIIVYIQYIVVYIRYIIVYIQYIVVYIHLQYYIVVYMHILYVIYVHNDGLVCNCITTVGFEAFIIICTISLLLYTQVASLHKIESENPNNVNKYKRAVFNTWLDNDTTASWSSLLSALGQVDHTLRDKVKDMYNLDDLEESTVNSHVRLYSTHSRLCVNVCLCSITIKKA